MDISGLLENIGVPEREMGALVDRASRMSDEEFEQFFTITKQLSKNGESEMLNRLTSDLYDEVPVDTEIFFRHRDYFGKPGSDLYPRLLDDLIRLFEGDYTEVVLCGAIGWGKSFLATMIMCRILYEVSCLKNPQAAYDQAEDSTMFFPNISITLTQAKRVIFGKIKNALLMSPYFREKFSFDLYAEYMQFPKNIMLSAVAMSGVMGMDVFAAAMDETSFMDVVEDSKLSRGQRYDAAEVIYTSLARRMKSRFLKQGSLPGKLIMLSSVNYPNDFTERKKDEAKDNPLIFVLDYPEWGTKPPSKYLPGRFWVSMGTENEAPKVVEDSAEAQQHRDKGIEVIEVPLDFLPDFRRDIEGSLKDIAGKSKLLIQRFITQTEKIFEAADAGRQHPFTLKETTLLDGGGFIKELLARHKESKDGKMVWRPIVSPHKRRFCHIDLAKTGNAAGFCVGHPKGEVQVMRRSEERELYIETMPVVYIDVMLRVIPPQGGEINFGNIRSLIYELQNMGFLFELVTLDSYQSSDTIQILKGRGIKAGELSMDTSMEPYNEVKAALYEDRLLMYWYDIVLDELKYLVKKAEKAKIDHLPKRSKDVSDCLAGVVYNCVEWMRNTKRQALPPPSEGYLEGDVRIEQKVPDSESWILNR